MIDCSYRCEFVDSNMALVTPGYPETAKYIELLIIHAMYIPGI